MKIIFLSLFAVFFSVCAQAQTNYVFVPLSCNIGTWVAVLNDKDESSKEEILKAQQVIERAGDVLIVTNKFVESDKAIIYYLSRNPKLPKNTEGHARLQRTLRAIAEGLAPLTGMGFYCFSN